MGKSRSGASINIPYNLCMFDFDEKRLSEVPIVVLDTETTGLFPDRGHRVVELGAIRLENWVNTGELNQLVQPERPMDPRASSINRIYDEDLAGKPLFANLEGQLRDLCEGALMVAHNASFDAGFLGHEFAISSQSSQVIGGHPPFLNPWLCTLQLARRQFYFGRNSLGSIARKLGVRMGMAHRALSDVYMTAEILKRMARELEKQGIKTVGDLLHAQGGAIYAPNPSPPILPQRIAAALANGQQLRILYLAEGGESERVITPRFANQNDSIVYLTAFCHLRNAQRTFRVDRIFSAEIVDKT